MRSARSGAWLVFAHPPLPFFGQDRHIRRISTLATHGGWTTEFRTHRATFTVHAPARHGSSCAPCSAAPCGPGPPAASARDFNTEFSPATFPNGRILPNHRGWRDINTGLTDPALT